MSTTIEALEQRLAAVEQDLARLRLHLEQRPAEESSAERGTRLLRDADLSQPAISAATAKAFAELGITGEPVGIEKLHEMMLAAGVDPNDSAFSREIIAMREE
jgi:hypothetical protein